MNPTALQAIFRPAKGGGVLGHNGA